MHFIGDSQHELHKSKAVRILCQKRRVGSKKCLEMKIFEPAAHTTSDQNGIDASGKNQNNAEFSEIYFYEVLTI